MKKKKKQTRGEILDWNSWILCGIEMKPFKKYSAQKFLFRQVFD